MKQTLFIGLLALGLAQMAGDIFHISILSGVAAATGASPAPKVFSSVRGLETFSTSFLLEWADASGKQHELLLTPDVYSRIRGPYNRRNVYGAALAYGPVLVTDSRTRLLFEAVSQYALCGDAPLLQEIGVSSPETASRVRIRLSPRTGTAPGDFPLLLEPNCS